eukprot:1699101-Pyramimonas_sp.AAC.1
MHTAVKEGHVEVVGLVLQCGTPVEACDSDGQTALHLAALVRVCACAVCAVISTSRPRHRRPYESPASSSPIR